MLESFMFHISIERVTVYSTQTIKSESMYPSHSRSPLQIKFEYLNTTQSRPFLTQLGPFNFSLAN